MAGIFSWSTSAGSNTSVDGVSIAEGMAPSGVNNGMRAIMAVVRQTFASALESFFAGSSALPVANGGTGATSASAARTALSALVDTYQDLPVTSKSSAFTLANADRGGGYNYTGAAAAATINPNATTAINTGAVFVIRNNGSGSVTITRGSGVTLKVNGGTTSADATLAVGGVATLVKWGTDDWTVTGTGLS